jgi:hypothetical protein
MMLIQASFASCLQAEKRSASVLYLGSIVCFACVHCLLLHCSECTYVEVLKRKGIGV